MHQVIRTREGTHWVVLVLMMATLTTVHCSEIDVEAKYDDTDLQTVYFVPKYTLHLKCTVSKKEADHVYIKWKKDDTAIDEVPELKGRYKTFTFGNVFDLDILHTTELDAGNYYCLVHSKDPDELKTERLIKVETKMGVKVTSSILALDGEELVITCMTYGLSSVSWMIYNDTHNVTLTESTDRISLEDDQNMGRTIANAVLRIAHVQMWDRGHYVCIGQKSDNADDVVTSETMVRIKDKYAALWPFLGICAEVIILCVIILIYEKKRNKSELDESDTDQSPEQKNNASDSGKDSANLRHRQQ